MNNYIFQSLFLNFLNERFSVIDAGADLFNDGREAWNKIGPKNISLHVFDGDANTCKTKNHEAKVSGLDHHYFPSAVGEKKGSLVLGVPENSSNGSAFQIADYLDKLTYDNNLSMQFLNKPTWQIELPMMDLDTYCSDVNIDYVDFLKMNIQGSELNCLRGFSNGLKNVLGVELEMSFSPIYKNSPTFSDIDPFLRNVGFDFFDLLAPNQMGYKNNFIHHNPTRTLSIHNSPKKQLFEAHFLYFKNPITNIHTKLYFDKNKSKYLKLAFIAEAYGHLEFAFSLCEEFKKSMNYVDAIEFERLLKSAAEKYCT